MVVLEQITEELSERQIVVFKLGREEYGVNIHTIKEIIRNAEVTKIPEIPDYIEGVINLRGEITAIINLRKVLSMGSLEVTEKGRVLIMDLGSKQVGIIVDGVSEVIKLEKEQILDADNLGSAVASENVLGMGKVGDRLIILLDLNKVLIRLNIGDLDLSE